MADYHVLTMSRLDRLDVVFHFPVPDQVNFAGVNLRVALKAHLEAAADDGIIASQYPGIQGAELTQMQAGEVYEHREAVEFDANLTKALKRDQVDARWTALGAIISTRVVNLLDFWGYDRTVP